jgi:hypothetical protein
MTKEDIIRYIGPTINAQLTLTWDTEQTLVQMIEILDGETPTLDDFLEYVLGNAIEDITNISETQGELEHYTKLVNDQGEEVLG